MFITLQHGHSENLGAGHGNQYINTTYHRPVVTSPQLDGVERQSISVTTWGIKIFPRKRVTKRVTMHVY